MKTYSNTINRYDEMIYNSRPVRFDEFISNKYNKVHVELFNSALNKYYNSLINDLVNEKFMFEFFKLVESSTYDDDFETYFKNFYDKVLSSDNYIKNTISKLSIDGNLFCRRLLDLTNTFIDNIKNTIDNNELLYSLIEELIKATDIGDFRIIYYDAATFLDSENDYDDNWGDEEILSYVVKHESNNNINTYKVTQNNFIKSEMDDFVFILETASGTRIEYNLSGEFVLLLDEAKYNDEALKNFNFDSYIDKTNKNILNLFKEYALSLYKDYHKIIEIKNTEYWKPSSIIIISNIRPYTKKIIDLKEYWNYNQGKIDLNISDIKLTDYKVTDAEIIELNYIKGKATLISKRNDMIFEVPFEYLNNSIEVSEEMMIDLIN